MAMLNEPAPGEASAARTSEPQTSGPDHRDLYLIVIGILAGILIGPYVLGALKPELYRRVFVGGVDESKRLEEQEAAVQRMLQTGMAGASDVAMEEKLADLNKTKAPLLAQYQEALRQRESRLANIGVSLVLAVVALMVIETLIDPMRPDFRSRLSTARYAVLAAWLALLFARPELLKSLPLLFLGGVIVVALAAAFVPMGKR